MLLILLVMLMSTFGTVRFEPDSAGYIDAGRQPWRDMLVGPRTLAYPLLLRVVAGVSPEFGLVPYLQLAIHCLAVGFFYLALGRFGASPGHALAAASGLLWSVLPDADVSSVMADSLGRSLAVLTVGLLLWLAANPKSALGWAGLTASVALSYHARPAYLFLVPLAPALGLALLRIHNACRRQTLNWTRHVALLGIVAVCPLAAYCTMRLALVGQFGLVSFGGYGLAGIAVELLDGPTAEALEPEDLRPLAHEILRRRDDRGIKPAFEPSGRLDVDRFLHNSDVNIHALALPAVARLSGSESDTQDPLAVNTTLNRFARAVIAAKKHNYARLVAGSFRAGFRLLPVAMYVLRYLLAAGALLCLVRILVRPGPPRADAGQPSASYTAQTLVLVCVAYLSAKLLLVAAVAAPLLRYVGAAAVFLPAVLAFWIYREFELIANVSPARPPTEPPPERP
ncbi:MAG: hypothetical protein NUV77_26235 [Thermoguttaceae bacterium]|nr:hypothetical protein [Thermoguttaceae bacterium]